MHVFKVVAYALGGAWVRTCKAALSAAVGLLAVGALPAQAEPVKVKAGQKGIIYALYSVNEACQGGVRPRVSVKVPPTNGIAEVALVPYRIPAGKTCAGQTFKVVIVTYAPRPGFKGRDSVGIEALTDMYVNDVGERSYGKTVDLVVE